MAIHEASGSSLASSALSISPLESKFKSLVSTGVGGVVSTGIEKSEGEGASGFEAGGAPGIQICDEVARRGDVTGCSSSSVNREMVDKEGWMDIFGWDV